MFVPPLLCPGATEIAAGGRHSVAVADDRSLWATGDNGFGQFGNGGPTDIADFYSLGFIMVVSSGRYDTVIAKKLAYTGP